MLKVSIENLTKSRHIKKRLFRHALTFAHRELQLPDGEISVVFVNDATIKQLNTQYLQHDYPTDILTFPLQENPLIAELYISVETAKENARLYGETIENELLRLLFHGLLHLAGYDDKTQKQRSRMEKMENTLLRKFREAPDVKKNKVL